MPREKLKPAPPQKMTAFHVAIAAEAVAAAQFARCSVDVSVQYGANQPEYDLIVSKGEAMLRVSVKGSQDGGWGLTQSYLENRDYHGAIQQWEARHSKLTALCFVQFKNVDIGDMPRVYLAWPSEVAARLRSSADGRGETILYESHTWGPRAAAVGTIDAIPQEWRFSRERVALMLDRVEHFATGDTASRPANKTAVLPRRS